jgi:hypothetical protein
MTVLASCVLLFPRKHVLTFKKLGLFRNFVTKKKKFKGLEVQLKWQSTCFASSKP